MPNDYARFQSILKHAGFYVLLGCLVYDRCVFLVNASRTLILSSNLISRSSCQSLHFHVHEDLTAAKATKQTPQAPTNPGTKHPSFTLLTYYKHNPQSHKPQPRTPVPVSHKLHLPHLLNVFTFQASLLLP